MLADYSHDLDDYFRLSIRSDLYNIFPSPIKIKFAALFCPKIKLIIKSFSSRVSLFVRFPISLLRFSLLRFLLSNLFPFTPVGDAKYCVSTRGSDQSFVVLLSHQVGLGWKSLDRNSIRCLSSWGSSTSTRRCCCFLA